MMEYHNPMNVRSTRSRIRCETCRARKKGCIPEQRDWTKGERCDRCKSLGLPCGPSITAKEYEERLPQLLRRDVDEKRKQVPYLPSFGSSQPAIDAYNSTTSYGVFNDGEDVSTDLTWLQQPIFEQSPEQSHESMSEGILGTGSHKSLSDGQGATRNVMDWSPTPILQQDRTQFDNYISEGFSKGIEENHFEKTVSKESEIFGLLRKLGLKVKMSLYCKSILPKSEDANQNYLQHSVLQMLQVHMEKEIRLIVDKVESLADEADYNGRLCQAQMAYTGLIEKLNQIGDDVRRISVLSKLAKFHMRNHDDTQAEETLRTLLRQDGIAEHDKDEWRIMLADSYNKSALGISDLSLEAGRYLGAGSRSLNLETPCPAFHLALQDKAPAEVMSIILSRQGLEDSLDVLHRPSIHMAIELNRKDIVKELMLKTPTCVRAQDSFERTPLQLAVQQACEHRTSSQHSRTAICPQATLCQILLSADADRNARNGAGCTTLTSAARAGCPFVCKDLLFGRYRTEPACINPILSYKQPTPLQAAAEEGHDDVVDIFLKAGASASESRHDGKTAYQLAKDRGHHGIVRRLKQALDEEEVVLHNSVKPTAINPFMGGE